MFATKITIQEIIFLFVSEEIRQVKTSAITYKCLSCRKDVTGTRLMAFACTAPWETPAWIHWSFLQHPQCSTDLWVKDNNSFWRRTHHGLALD